MTDELKHAILHALLKAQPDFVSGGQLATDLGVSRVSVWSHLEQMRAEGLQVEAIRKRGYRLLHLPPTLHGPSLAACLRLNRVTVPCQVFPTIDSTNSEADRQLAAGRADPLVVVAAHQTSGRGRQGRSWYSEDAGNLYLSFGFRPHLPPSRMQRFTLWVGLQLCALLNRHFDLPVRLKWPNDLVADGRKIAGILTEAKIDSDHIRELVVGCGINVNGQVEDWPEEIRDRATSLAALKGAPLDLNPLAATLIKGVLDAFDCFAEDANQPDFDDLWQEYDALDGRSVQVLNTLGQTFEGVARGIDPFGALIVETSDGQQQRVQAADVTLSPAPPTP